MHTEAIQGMREELERRTGRSLAGYSDIVIVALHANRASAQDDYEQELRGVRALKGRI